MQQLKYGKQIAAMAIIALSLFNRIQPAVCAENYANGLYDFLDEGALYLELNADGDIVEALVKAKAGTQAVNVIAFDLEYSADVLAIERISYGSESFCELFAYDNFDNEKGEAGIACGTPNPEKKGELEIAKITFRIKQAGDAKISFSENSLMLLNDGTGKNIFSQPIGAELHVQ